MVGQRFGRWTVVEQAADTFRERSNRPNPLKVTNYLCECDCGTKRVVAMSRLKNGHSTSCGCKRIEANSKSGPEGRHWKGGLSRWKTPQGYVMCQVYGREGRIMEHRLIYEQHLGRPLRDDESVHHKNGIRDDNRLENLELWSSSHPSGQRVEDLTAWAKHILLLYAG